MTSRQWRRTWDKENGVTLSLVETREKNEADDIEYRIQQLVESLRANPQMVRTGIYVCKETVFVMDRDSTSFEERIGIMEFAKASLIANGSR
jgi:flagellar biosynthesis regulator FlaF